MTERPTWVYRLLPMRQKHQPNVYQRKKRRPDGTVVTLPTWWIKYRKDGRVFRESSHSEDYADAAKLIDRRKAEILTGKFLEPETARIPVSELLDDVLLDYRVNGKAVRFAENSINNHVRQFFGAMRAARLSTSDVQRYVEYRRSANQGMRRYRGHLKEAKPIPVQPASNATINRELALLKHAFYLGIRHTPPKVARVPYIPLLSENNTRKGFFEHAEYTVLRQALPEHLRPVLTFAYYTGCRRGEIVSLRWNQVDLDNRVVRLEPGTTKNDEPRILPLGGELLQVLAMQRAVHNATCPTAPWVFFRGKHGKALRSFRTAWRDACVAAGLIGPNGEADRLFHDLRRSGVRNLIRAGVPEVVAMRISGHKTRSVFDRYNIVSERDLLEAARRLDDYLRGLEKPATGENGHTLGTPGTLTPNPTGETSRNLLQ